LSNINESGIIHILQNILEVNNALGELNKALVWQQPTTLAFFSIARR
jgi:hypothetical protein